ncbi:nicotinamide mononucleotide transporter [Alteromonadaceae bacterium Bs31]|nr:nicotinamide mononucleotide transporter [Alteromonadaceae bacterium Bs31]
MQEFFQVAVSEFLQQSWLELIAVALGLAYLALAMRQNVWCWPCAFVSTALLAWVFFDVSLVMESLLHIYYMGMAVYGYWCWHKSKSHKALAITFWRPGQHLFALLLIASLTFISGYFLKNHSEAAWPYLDSFTTWGSVVTTYMVTRKIFENWLYWLVIDSAALFLYWDRGLYAASLLMIVYLVMVLFGIYSWWRQIEPEALMEPAR